MGLTNIIKSAIPDVPPFKGVPNLLKSAAAPFVQDLIIDLLTPDPNFPQISNTLSVRKHQTIAYVDNGFKQAATKQWGIYRNAAPYLIADSVLEYTHKDPSKVAQAPIENGSFASYNKVASPFDGVIRMIKTGNARSGEQEQDQQAARSQFLAILENMSNSTMLFDVVTPEATYTNCTIQGYEYKRTVKDGATAIIVDVHVVEVRQSTAQYITVNKPITSSKSDNAISSKSEGATQTAEVAGEIKTEQDAKFAATKAAVVFLDFAGKVTGISGALEYFTK